MYGESTSVEEERIATAVVEGAYRLHSRMGPGLLESVYETCMAHELERMGFAVQRQVPVPIEYDGIHLEVGFRLDLLINRLVIVEIKSVETPHPVHALQTRTYLRLTGLRLALLINFNVTAIKDGIKRIVATRERPSPSFLR